MTKPMPTGYIKEHPSPLWLKFNFLLETVDLDNEICHLFVADTEFDEKKLQKKNICMMRFFLLL